MNPLILVAALAAVSPPGLRAEFTAAPADAKRTIIFQLRVLTIQGDPPAGLDAPLTDAQLRTLLTEVGARGNLLTAPRVTVTEGQTAKVFTGQARSFDTGVEAVLKDGSVQVLPTTKTVEVGTRFELTGRAAAGGAVAARLKYTDTRVGDVVQGAAVTVRHVGADGLLRNGVVTLVAPEVSTATAQATVRVPAGRAVVIPGPVRTEEVREEFGPPVLSRIPYVSRLFTNVGVSRVPVRTYLVLTATLIEDESALPAAPAPRPVGR
ncbi:hypothetical protein [Urbifossiella limnaea]|uniref:Bacterial type II and III secretion system protein n=1 Tax=Urbifossiella limnaea TaxID=2528023 RepID=A0A517Y2U5_9BACT|nr:hypothetical protein [Urbifossiella limnaea]QDU24018.1 Bacterial type II and III secretion system protein [Urbifossiella limnaea]